MDAAHGVDRVEDVVVGVRRRERQREHLGAGPLGDRERRLVGIALAEPRQPVHREEVDARRDQLVGERVLVGVAVGAGALRVDPDDVEVERMRVARDRARAA